MSEFSKFTSWVGGSKSTFSPSSKKPLKGFSRELPVIIDSEVENFRTFAYAQVSLVCDLSGQPWQLISVAERQMEDKTILELEFSLANPKAGKPSFVQSMYFDITACMARTAEDDDHDDENPFPFGINVRPKRPVTPAVFLSQDRKRREKKENKEGFRSFRGY